MAKLTPHSQKAEETCTFRESHVVQRVESWFPGSLKVARDKAKEGGRGQVTEERLPVYAGNNAEGLKDVQQRYRD